MNNKKAALSTTLVTRFLHGIGAIVYGGTGVGGLALWPISIMMWDPPKEHRSFFLPVLWLGVLGFGPVSLYSSYELGMAARYSYRASEMDAFLPITYAAVWSGMAGMHEYLMKKTRKK